jgi:hypothetical protein
MVFLIFPDKVSIHGTRRVFFDSMIEECRSFLYNEADYILEHVLLSTKVRLNHKIRDSHSLKKSESRSFDFYELHLYNSILDALTNKMIMGAHVPVSCASQRILRHE